MSTASGTFQIDQWDEKPYQTGEGGRKLTRATVTQTYSGDIDGKAVTEYLMVYRADGTAEYTGVQRIEGTVSGRKGAFVLRLSGIFDGKGAKAETVVVSGAGQGDLDRMTGKGQFHAALGSTGDYSLQYDLPNP